MPVQKECLLLISQCNFLLFRRIIPESTDYTASWWFDILGTDVTADCSSHTHTEVVGAVRHKPEILINHYNKSTNGKLGNVLCYVEAIIDTLYETCALWLFHDGTMAMAWTSSKTKHLAVRCSFIHGFVACEESAAIFSQKVTQKCRYLYYLRARKWKRKFNKKEYK